MKNQRLLRVVELMGEGSLATAEDLLVMELNERAEAAKEQVKRSLVGSVLESEVAGTVANLGQITVDATQGQVRLQVADLNEAVQKAVALAAFCEGSQADKYKASLNESKTAVVIQSEGEAVFEMVIEGDQLVSHCQLSSEDLLQFKKTGTLASA